MDLTEEITAAETLLTAVVNAVQDIGARVKLLRKTSTELEVTFLETPTKGKRTVARHAAGHFEVQGWGHGEASLVPLEYAYGTKAWIPTESNRSGASSAAGVLCQRIVDVASPVHDQHGL